MSLPEKVLNWFGLKEDDPDHDPHVMIPENTDRKKFHRYKTPRGGANCGAIDTMTDSGSVLRESDARDAGFEECGNCRRVDV